MPDDEARDDDDARAHLDARRATSSDANMAGASTRGWMGPRAWDRAMGGEDAKAGRSWATRAWMKEGKNE